MDERYQFWRRTFPRMTACLLAAACLGCFQQEPGQQASSPRTAVDAAPAPAGPKASGPARSLPDNPTPRVSPDVPEEAPNPEPFPPKSELPEPLRPTANETIEIAEVTPDGFWEVVQSQAGKVVLVDCWATWCTACREQFPHTVELSRRHASRGLVVISVSFDAADKKEKALGFLEKHDARMINLLVGDEAFDALDIDNGALPHYKLYDRTGKLVRKFVSDELAETVFTTADIDAAVEELLAE